MAIVKINPKSGNPYRDSNNGEFAKKDGNSSSENSDLNSNDITTNQNVENQNEDNESSTERFVYVEISDEECLDFITSTPQLNSKYESLSDEGKKKFEEKVRNKLSQKMLEKVIHEKFDNSSINDFTNFHNECDKALTNKGSLTSDITGKTYTAQELMRAARSMCGNPMSFEYQKYCRLGREKMKQINGNKFSDADYDRMEEWKDKMYVLTNNWETPKDIRVYRLLNTDYLMANFKDAFSGFNTYDYFGYKKIQGSNGSKNLSEADIIEIAKRMKRLVGVAVDRDGGCPSFGMDESYSHMAKHVTEDKQRQVQILFDCPKGTKMYVTDYYYETEGYMANNTSYFIKDVYPTKRKVTHGSDTYEIDTLTLVYGIRGD